jgi:integrase
MHPPSFGEWLKRRGIGLHKVRHLNASTLIATQPLPIVSARLGHSRPDITLRTYSHVLPGQDDAAAEAIDAALG